MPNIKSAKKRVKVNATKALRNQMLKNALRTELKKFDAAIAEGDEQARKVALARVCKCVDQAAAKGILHKNKAARAKSRLTKKAAV
ncbi:MAG: 30S ribosomal protein S20 [Clostridia bacterium]|nr:30S ribosomal protein S20 [Clostridia bacterium]MBQ3078066.1 30S ribosomal protein S20 [Clostridia bacterium]